ncbi:MAG: hypothetical protein SOY53_08360 [Prevotella sp.]|nr:hypothetical protein [Leyella stercorea]MDY4089419.1 hypothetical protein [Prevotella sp.]
MQCKCQHNTTSPSHHLTSHHLTTPSHHHTSHHTSHHLTISP